MRKISKKIVGLSKISTGRKISLLKPVAEKLQAKEGDDIVFYEDNGRIFIEKA